MSAGSDVEARLTDAQRRNTTRSNIFGVGYEHGSKTSIGCSYKGRIWSRRITNVEALTRWCSSVGEKLLNDGIDSEEVIRGTLVPEMIDRRPDTMPFAIDWPDVMYKKPETTYTFLVDGAETPLYLTDIELTEPATAGDIRFEISSDDTRIPVTLSIFKEGETKDCKFSVGGGSEVRVKDGAREHSLKDFFYRETPVIWFVDGSSLEGNSYTKLRKDYDPYSPEKIQVWDWAGVDIQKESQGSEKQADSIQYRVIQQLKNRDYVVVFDDDGKGEVADVVGIRVEEDGITVELYHCKWSREPTPGARIADLYEVCGQAQKCIRWKEKRTELFTHLLRREALRLEKNEATRLEVGAQENLLTIKEMSRFLPVNFNIYIVQPGLSKARASESQLELLSVTENYLMETYMLPFQIIASA